MDQLRGKFVNLVLAIQQGRGMAFAKAPITVSASLNGERSLESDPVDADDMPPFNTNLLWEIDKKDLKRMRCLNQPLRLEVMDASGKVGHLHLLLKSAQVLSDGGGVKCRWHKLIVGRKKSWHPELLLGLALMGAQQCEEDFIKIGDHGDHYWFNILIKIASNLDLLLPESLVFSEYAHKYYLEFRIFDNTVKSQEFYKDLTSVISFDEKIVVKIQTTLEQLQYFLDNQENCEVGFYCDKEQLGIGYIELGQLTDGQHKVDLEIFLRSVFTDAIPTGDDGRKPSIKLEINLTKVEEQMKKTPVILESHQYFSRFSLEINFEKIVWANSNLQKFAFQFFHPQTEDCIRTSYVDFTKNEYNFDNLLIKFHYLSTKAEIQDLIKEFPPIFCIIDENNGEVCRKLELDEIDKSFVTILDVKNMDILAKLTLSLALQDESVPTQFVRSIQQTEVSDMEAQWEEKNRNLQNQIQKLNNLQEELQDRINELTIATRVKAIENNTAVQESQTDIEATPDTDLSDHIEQLEAENQKLKETIIEQQDEMKAFRKTSLTKEQTTLLLQELRVLEEKFEVAQKTKNYFKEQWERALQNENHQNPDDYWQYKEQII